MRNREAYEDAAIAYIQAMANIDRQVEICAGRLEDLRNRLEGVHAIRYDDDGGKPVFVDLKPELLDEMAACIEDAERAVLALRYERADSVRLFASNINATICWLKHGRRLTWGEVARETDYSTRACQRRERAGLEYIFANMPYEYRQVRA